NSGFTGLMFTQSPCLGGPVCVTGFNPGGPKVLVWDIFSAPNANLFDCNFHSSCDPNHPNYLCGQTLMSVSFCVIKGNSQFTCCVTLPTSCAQADLGPSQWDLGWFPLEQCLRNPGLIGTPILFGDDNNIAGVLLGGQCNTCCIRMTGGGHTETI